MAKFKEKAELFCGLISGLLGVIAPSLLVINNFTRHDGLIGTLLVLLFYMAPPCLIAFGSYTHIIGQRSWGRILVYCGWLILLTLSYGYISGMVWIIFFSKTSWLPLYLFYLCILFATLTSGFTLRVEAIKKKLQASPVDENYRSDHA